MVALAVLLVGTGLEVVASQWLLARTGRVYAARARDLGRVSSDLATLVRALGAQEAAVAGYARTHRHALLITLQAARAADVQAASDLRRAVRRVPALRPPADAALSSAAHWRQGVAASLAANRPLPDHSGFAAWLSAAAALRQGVDGAMAENGLRAQAHDRQWLWRVSVAWGAMVLLLAALVGRWVRRGIRRLRDLEAAAQRVLNGQAETLSGVAAGPDEIGALAERLETMTRRLHGGVLDLAAQLRVQRALSGFDAAAAIGMGEADLARRVVQLIQELAPSPRVAVHLLDPSDCHLLDATGDAGGARLEARHPGGCLALRTGQPVQSAIGGVVCTQCAALRDNLCLPLQAMGRAVGVVHREGTMEGGPPEVLLTAAMHAGIALNHVHLLENLRRQAQVDELTGLFNYRQLFAVLEQRMADAVRRGSPLGLLMVDLDHFKRFNDEFGHAEGDAVLRRFGAAVSATLRPGDVACRYGGEEFAIILPETPLGDALHVAEGLRCMVRQLPGLPRPLTLSVGVAPHTPWAASPAELVRAADLALYEAKRGGRDRIVIAAGSDPEVAAVGG